jgi:hypothetical protein
MDGGRPFTETTLCATQAWTRVTAGPIIFTARCASRCARLRQTNIQWRTGTLRDRTTLTKRGAYGSVCFHLPLASLPFGYFADIVEVPPPRHQPESAMAKHDATWKPHTQHSKLSTEDRKELPASVFAFPTERKEPLIDAAHVRTALARFDQVKGVSDAERDQAFANIKKAAGHFGVDIKESTWRELGQHPQT